MKIKARWHDGKLYFKNFVVIKEGENFYGVYRGLGSLKNKPITSAATLKQAAKKAKLLQLGYEACKEDEDNEWKWTV